MPKEMFPPKKSGDGLTAAHINNMGRVLTNLSGGNQGSGLQGTSGWITGVAGKTGPDFRTVRVVEETTDAGVYTVRLRYWDEANSLWKNETEDDQLLDARVFTHDSSSSQRGPALVCGDLLTVIYDGQRGMWLPVQMLFPNSRWAWVSESIPARSGADVSSKMCKLVEETLDAAGTAIEWTYLLDDDDAEINVRVFNGFPDAIPADLHARIGWNSIGQYEIKGVPCTEDAELTP